MADTPSCGELQERVQELEEELGRQDVWFKDQERYRIHFSLANDVMYSLDHDFRLMSISPNVHRILGYHPEELLGKPFHDLNILAPEYYEQAVENIAQVLSGRKIDSAIYEFFTREGARRFAEVSGVPLMRNGKAIAVISVARDITERKRVEEELKAKEKELENKTTYLEEVNIALKVLLDIREKEKKDAQETIVATAKKLVYPYLEQLEQNGPDEQSRLYLKIIRANFDALIASCTSQKSSKYLLLTSTEIQVADLVKEGKSTKEIAEFLCVSPNAVSFHRGNIRKKLGLLGEKKNLRSHLQVLEAAPSSSP